MRVPGEPLLQFQGNWQGTSLSQQTQTDSLGPGFQDTLRPFFCRIGSSVLEVMLLLGSGKSWERDALGTREVSRPRQQPLAALGSFALVKEKQRDLDL